MSLVITNKCRRSRSFFMYECGITFHCLHYVCLFYPELTRNIDVDVCKYHAIWGICAILTFSVFSHKKWRNAKFIMKNIYISTSYLARHTSYSRAVLLTFASASVFGVGVGNVTQVLRATKFGSSFAWKLPTCIHLFYDYWCNTLPRSSRAINRQVR